MRFNTVVAVLLYSIAVFGGEETQQERNNNPIVLVKLIEPKEGKWEITSKAGTVNATMVDLEALTVHREDVIKLLMPDYKAFESDAFRRLKYSGIINSWLAARAEMRLEVDNKSVALHVISFKNLKGRGTDNLYATVLNGVEIGKGDNAAKRLTNLDVNGAVVLIAPDWIIEPSSPNYSLPDWLRKLENSWRESGVTVIHAEHLKYGAGGFAR